MTQKRNINKPRETSTTAQNNDNEQKQNKGKYIAAVFGLIGSLIGGISSCAGSYLTTSQQYNHELRLNAQQEKILVYEELMTDLYSINQMNDGLIKVDLVKLKSDAYNTMAKVRILGNAEVSDLYSQVLSRFFEEQIYDGDLIDNKLVPAIQEDLGTIQ